MILLDIRRHPDLLQRDLVPRLGSVLQVVGLGVDRSRRRRDGAGEAVRRPELGVVVEPLEGPARTRVAARRHDEVGFAARAAQFAEPVLRVGRRVHVARHEGRGQVQRLHDPAHRGSERGQAGGHDAGGDLDCGPADGFG